MLPLAPASRSRLSHALAFALALWPATTQAAEAPIPHLAALESWLDTRAPWPRRPDAPQIRLVTPSQAAALSGDTLHTGEVPRGYYDPESATIYLVRPWSPSDPQDVSVLLHELVHHRQAAVPHWRCAGAQELPAYRLQEAWLNDLGLKARVNWIALVLAAECAARDKHPD